MRLVIGLDADHDAAGLGLVQDVGRDDLHHHRIAHALGEPGRLGGRSGDAFARHRNAVGVGDQLAFRRRQRRAPVRLHRIQHLADRNPVYLQLGHRSLLSMCMACAGSMARAAAIIQRPAEPLLRSRRTP